jgi:Protein of unknown function (DUF1580)
MLDLSTEKLIPFTEAVKLLPRRRGKKAHLSTLHRWCTCGVKGVRLEVVQVGGTRCTSREALSRFWARLTEKAGLDSTEMPLVASPALKRKRADAAERELSKLGV